MNELNEKLAELCGMERCGFYWKLNNQLAYKAEELEFASCAQLDDWNPTTNLNQLKMCYEAAEKAFGQNIHPDPSFEEVYTRELRLLFNALDPDGGLSARLASAPFKHPELVAQAILNAKGGELR